MSGKGFAEAWAAAKAAAGEGALVTVGERETTVEAYARKDRQSIGYGYGDTPEDALWALVAKIEKDKADG